MVIFKAEPDHFISEMCMINTFRKDSSFCDITLLIGKQSLHAHRCVLAAGSPYFSSLFLGQFSEENMKEIDLSEVTSSITALERIVDYIYTGEIDIDKENLECTMKLSSFFLVESLRNFCCTFMTNNLSLTTCLRYYLYSVDHGMSNIVRKTWQIIQSRFHDHLIYEQDTLGLTTDEMQFLLGRNILQHCSNVCIVRFIAEWVNTGLTERHVLIAKEIFDSLIGRVDSPQISPSQLSHELTLNSLYEMTESSLSDMNIESKGLFLNSFEQILGKMTTDNEIAVVNLKSRPGKETAIIALFQSDDATENSNEILVGPIDSAETFDEKPTYGPWYLCAYLPRSRCWYSLRKINHKTTTFSIPNFQCECDALHDEILFLNGEEILMSDLNQLESLEINHLKYDSYSYSDFLDDQIELQHSNVYQHKTCVAAGNNNSRYFVTQFNRYDNDFDHDGDDFDHVLDTYFIVYKLQKDGKSWQKKFQTESIALPSGEVVADTFTHLNAKISTVSNELLVVCSGDELNTCILFVADLNQRKGRPVLLLSPVLDKQNLIYTSMQIVETHEAMYIVTDGTTNTSKDNRKVKVVYEYRFNSKQLREVNTVVNAGQLVKNNDNSYLHPGHSAAVGEGLWYIEGNNDQASFLTKVTVDDDRNPVVEHHTPPPFHIMDGETAMFASIISSNILDNKELVTRYLGNEQEKATLTNISETV